MNKNVKNFLIICLISVIAGTVFGVGTALYDIYSYKDGDVTLIDETVVNVHPDEQYYGMGFHSWDLKIHSGNYIVGEITAISNNITFSIRNLDSDESLYLKYVHEGETLDVSVFVPSTAEYSINLGSIIGSATVRIDLRLID